MGAKLGKAERKAFRIANLLDDAADAIRKRSKRAYREGRMSLEEYMEARAKELELRGEVSVLMATDLSAVLETVSGAGENIELAIRDAKGRVERVQSVRDRLEIVATLIGLAGAMATGNAKLVLEASKAVSEASNSG